ncbi:DUF3240 domain-containing protein [Henriciella mobilis]|uniref:DUF3240 family protein n=1 Tax=Henriciella mobilis TaxID=2305467 RepID=UPI000E6631F1|nr:DUF3240 domain-containing protein [Henriciella mobilis]RIJ19180.1 DUF3240 domain-containing protein [Henriciella mobilis]
MDPNLCKLTLVYPPRSEDAVIAFLLDQQPPLPGFTSWHGSGHGLGFDNATTAERVEGRVSRRILSAILEPKRAEGLIESIRLKLPLPHLIYWIEPVLSAGRLT